MVEWSKDQYVNPNSQTSLGESHILILLFLQPGINRICNNLGIGAFVTLGALFDPDIWVFANIMVRLERYPISHWCNHRPSRGEAVGATRQRRLFDSQYSAKTRHR